MSALVLPPLEDPTRPLAALRRAEAARLARLLAAGARTAGPAAVDVAARIGQLSRAAPDEVVDVLADPLTGLFLRLGRVADAAGVIAVELAWRGRLGAPVELRGPVAGVRRDVWLDGERITVADGVRPSSSRFPRIDGEVTLALVDPNPLASLEDHPDKHGNALSLGERSVDEWRTALAAALALVATHLPGVRAEMELVRFVLIPVGWEPERHLSASYREYPGAAYLTLHPSAATLAEGLVHEFQHGKLNLASWHDPLLENGFDVLVPSPVRPDARPLQGVLLAAHAFVAVAELYRRMLAAGDAAVRPRLADVIAKNDEALRTLAAHARPTAVGRALLAELTAWHAQHLALGLPLAAGAHE